MGVFVLVGLFAAFGILCSIWTVLGVLLTGGSGGVIVCRGTKGFSERAFLQRCLFLREMGLLRCRLILVDQGLDESERKLLERFGGRIEIYTPEELCSGLELERNRLE